MSVPGEAPAANCARSTCYVPDTACVLGLENCEHLTRAEPELSGSGAADGSALPWSGSALGLSDLFPLAAVGRPHVVGVVGAAGAGKTTLLAAHWIGARRGIGEFGRMFAGSYSLSGWHQIARHLQWVPWGSGFPPHTSAVSERLPSLLHVAMNTVDRTPKHVFYTDAPGEWFSRWAEEPAEVPGAQWVADQSDAFVILSDSHALSGPERGVARSGYESLASQLATAAKGRPVIPVLTKADIPVPAPIAEFVTNLNQRLFSKETVRVSAKTDVYDAITKPIDLGVESALEVRYIDSEHGVGRWAEQLAPRINPRRGLR